MNFLNPLALEMAKYLDEGDKDKRIKAGIADLNDDWARWKEQFEAIAIGPLDDNGLPLEADSYRRRRVVLAALEMCRAGEIDANGFMVDVEYTTRIGIPRHCVHYIERLVQLTRAHAVALKQAATATIVTHAIEPAQFSGRRTLTAIDMTTSGMESIPHHAFYQCVSLETIKLPHSLVTIQPRAFGHCAALLNIVLPESTRHVGEGGFFNCASLTEIALPSKLGIITRVMFAGCKQLKHVDLKHITRIGVRGFANCVQLRTCKLPRVKQIRDGAFFGTSLTRATLPAGAKLVGMPFERRVRVSLRL